MIDINEINEEIKKLEESECTTYPICQKLAILYIVRDHFNKNNNIMMSSSTPTVKTISPTV